MQQQGGAVCPCICWCLILGTATLAARPSPCSGDEAGACATVGNHAVVSASLFSLRASRHRTNEAAALVSTKEAATATTVIPVATITTEPASVPRWAEGGLTTMHGCECAESWQYDDLTLNGCVYTEEGKVPWCFVKDSACSRAYKRADLTKATLAGSEANVSNLTKQPLGNTSNSSWDFCTVPEEVTTYFTEASAHCLPRWEFNDKVYSGCSQTQVNGSSWCYVAETQAINARVKAPEGDKLQRWDNCEMPAKVPKFHTKNSCSCKPKWKKGSQQQYDCVADETVLPPAALTTTNTSALVAAELVGWCEVHEDERSCPKAEIAAETSVLWDVCFLLDNASKAELKVTLHGCHCLPEWSVDGINYHGCSKTPADGGEGGSWCPVAEANNSCSDSLTDLDARNLPYGAGENKAKWDWCSVDGAAIAGRGQLLGGGENSTWRTASDRFTAKEPGTPSWFKEVASAELQKYEEREGDLHAAQASYLRRRRSAL